MGYHSATSLNRLQHEGHVRTDIPEQRRTQRRQWQGKSTEVQQAYCRSKRNTREARGRRLQRLRSERVERVLAHLLDTGGDCREASASPASRRSPDGGLEIGHQVVAVTKRNESTASVAFAA